MRRERQEAPMTIGFDHFTTDPEVQRRLRSARAERAAYTRELIRRGGRRLGASRLTGRASLSIGVAAVAFVALASFAPWRARTGDAPPSSSFSISDVTAQVRDVPIAEKLDTH
jgi:hypothetical protein